MMKRILAIGSALTLLILLVPGAGAAQTTAVQKKKNFAYSQNPKTKSTKEPRTVADNQPRSTIEPQKPESIIQSDPGPEAVRVETTIAEKTLNVVRNAALKRSQVPTETYAVGPGDVLFVSLQNNSKASTYFTVLNDGTIDYPLAGELVPVAGMTTDEIEELLRSKIKIFEDPQVAVKVREYNSHRVTVLGLVEKSGERPIQREAVPLFVIRADAVVLQNADRVSVKRGDGNIESYQLTDPQWESVLVFAGNIIEFSTAAETVPAEQSGQFVFVSGEVISGGKFEFHTGLTLIQTISLAGGTRRSGVKKVVVRRRNAAGLLESSDYNLKSINDGKAPDPMLSAGDVIEVRN